ncbi:sugar ABC transporter substrate-binding protein, partial [Mesorhizobium sp. M1A.F.Ca.ET.072.01.1.1]
MQRRTVLQLGIACLALGIASPALADPMADAKAVVERYASKVEKWDGPTTGPKGAAGKTIVVLGADMKNGGILGVTKGVE